MSDVLSTLGGGFEQSFLIASEELDYKLVLDVIALIVFAVLLSLTVRRARPGGP